MASSARSSRPRVPSAGFPRDQRRLQRTAVMPAPRVRAPGVVAAAGCLLESAPPQDPHFQPFDPLGDPRQCMEHSGPGVTTGNLKRSPPVGTEAGDVVLATGGDERAFERLYREHVGRVYGLARRMSSGEGAGEITQDVLVRAWEKLGPV